MKDGLKVQLTQNTAIEYNERFKQITLSNSIADWKHRFRRHLSPEVAWNSLGTSFRDDAARRPPLVK